MSDLSLDDIKNIAGAVGSSEDAVLDVLTIVWADSNLEKYRETLPEKLGEEASTDILRKLTFLSLILHKAGAVTKGVEEDQDFLEQFKEESKADVVTNFIRAIIRSSYAEAYENYNSHTEEN